MKVYDETWLGADIMWPARRYQRNMTAIVAKVEPDAITIKGDTLMLDIKDDGSGEIVRKHYANKLHKVTDKIVVGFSCNDLDPALTHALQSYFETYQGLQRLSTVVRNICNFLNALFKKTDHGGVKLLIAGYGKGGPALYIVECEKMATFKQLHTRYAAVGVSVIVDDILCEEGGNMPIDDILFKVSDKEREHIEAFGSIMFHIGGNITGWRITAQGASELPLSVKELPTQVDIGDFIRPINGRRPYIDYFPPRTV